MTCYFTVHRTEDTRIDTDETILGWGFEYPCGTFIVDWNLKAFPPEDRLNHRHMSQYGCLDDVEQGSGGKVRVEQEFPE